MASALNKRFHLVMLGDVSTISISCNSRPICVPLRPRSVSASTRHAASRCCELNGEISFMNTAAWMTNTHWLRVLPMGVGLKLPYWVVEHIAIQLFFPDTNADGADLFKIASIKTAAGLHDDVTVIGCNEAIPWVIGSE
jgi:hypothetical protein